jgi:drug/metabolite transporter (DMT)-like permease
MSKKGYIYLGIAILAFSTLEIVTKFIVNDFNPLQLNFLRFFIGSVALIPFTIRDLKTKNLKLTFNDIFKMLCLGILAVPVSMSLFQIALVYIPASTLAVLISSNAIFVAPFSYFILHEKIDKSTIISLVLGIAGMLVIISQSSAMGIKNFIGIILAIAASVTFALFSVLGKKISSKTGSIILNCFVFLSGSLFMFPMLLLMKIPILKGLHSSNILYVLYLGLFVSALAYICMFKGLSYLPANKGSLVFFAKPIIAGALAYLLLGEKFTFSLILGTLLILTGIMFTIVSKNNDSNRKAAA